MLRRITILALAAVVGLWVAAPAQAQSSISLASSSSFVDFFTGSTQGSLDVVLGWTPGDNYTGNHTLSGALNSTTTPGAWGSGSTYSMTTYDPISLTNNGGGNWSTSASQLAGSSFNVDSSGGSTLFQGTLATLSFFEAPSGSNVVSMSTTIDGTGGFASTILNIVASITLAPGANINDVANSYYGVDEAGVITPEPGSLLLFATGLLGLLFVATRAARQRGNVLS